MALLLNVDERERIFDLIRHRFRDADPIEKVLDWIFDLAGTRVVGVETSNALGIPDFGEAEMFVLENFLHGKSDDAIRQAFAAENPGVEIGDAIARVRGSVIFKPLLVTH